MPNAPRTRLLAWIPALTWAGFIFFLSTLKAGSRPPPWVLSNDKVVHAVLFGILSFWIYFGVRRGHGRGRWTAALAGFLAASLYGGADEIHQMWTPTRVPDLMDWLADAVGAACVFVIALLPSRHEPSR